MIMWVRCGYYVGLYALGKILRDLKKTRSDKDTNNARKTRDKFDYLVLVNAYKQGCLNKHDVTNIKTLLHMDIIQW